MLDWEKIRIFNTVKRCGSMLLAGQELNLHTSTISRHIQQLEQQLGFQLFHRHSRLLGLTQQGTLLSEVTKKFESGLHNYINTINEMADIPCGILRVNATYALGSTFIASHMRQFFKKYPKLQIQFVLSDAEYENSWANVDVVLRTKPSKGIDIIERRLYSYGLGIYATKEYLSESPPLKKAEDLDNHQIIAFGRVASQPIPQVDWLLTVGRDGTSPRKPVMTLNNFTGIYRAVSSSLGIGTLPLFSVPINSNLVPVLENLTSPVINIYYVYPISLRGSKRVLVLRDYLLKQSIDDKSPPNS